MTTRLASRAVAAVVSGLALVALGLTPASATTAQGGNCPTYSNGHCYEFTLSSVNAAAVNTRAQPWITADYTYSQAIYRNMTPGVPTSRLYRSDCSGFVSMAWGLMASYATSDLYYLDDSTESAVGIAWHQVASGSNITLANIHAGDAIVWQGSGAHVVLIQGVSGSNIYVAEMTLVAGVETGMRTVTRNLSYFMGKPDPHLIRLSQLS